METAISPGYPNYEDGGLVIYTVDPDELITRGLRHAKWHRVGGPAQFYGEGSPFRNQILDHAWWYLDKPYSFKAYCTMVKPLMSDEAYFILMLTYST